METHKCKGSMSLWWANSKELGWNSRFMPSQRKICKFEPHWVVLLILVPSSQLHLMNGVGKHKLLVLCMLDFLDNSNMKGNLWNSTSDIHKFANNFFCWCLNIVIVSCCVNIVIGNVSNTPILIRLVLMTSLKNHNQQQQLLCFCYQLDINHISLFR